MGPDVLEVQTSETVSFGTGPYKGRTEEALPKTATSLPETNKKGV